MASRRRERSTLAQRQEQQDAAASPEQAAQQPADDPAADPIRASITSQRILKPPRIFLYGVHGIGKTTFAAEAPGVILLPTEEGSEDMEVPRFPLSTSSGQVLDNLRWLYKSAHDFTTVAIDSADWLEDIIQREISEQYSAKEQAYGKSAELAMLRMHEVLVALTYLRDKRGMAILFLAHSEVKRFDSPLTAPYDRYQPKLQRSNAALMQEWADCVFFATYDVTVKSEDVGFDKEVRRGISNGDRLIYTEERPAFYAKNRYGLPAELPLSWSAVEAELPYYQKQKEGGDK